ncbi:MAG: hypothetical protein J7L42_06060 [Elusimicrobia bacterium]|nr:hypothetical protein [Elusimicrobiota bacterium]
MNKITKRDKKKFKSKILQEFQKFYSKMVEKGIYELKIKRGKRSIYIRRGLEKISAAQVLQEKDLQEKSPQKVETINAPITGIFYRSPSPNSAPFINVPCQVKKGDVLCIIEAMKVMNKIESPFDCKIKKCVIENGSLVKQDEPIFEVER